MVEGGGGGVASANLTEGKRRGPLAALGERVREREREPPLGERDERPATRAQNEDGPAILHDRLRWPYPRHRRQRTGSLHASTW